MAVYVAVLYLHSRISNVIERVDVLLPPPSLKILEFAEKELKSFRNFVERLDSKSRERMTASLLGIIDTIEAYVNEYGFMYLDMNIILEVERYEDLSRGIHSLVEQLKEVEKEYYTLQEDAQKEVVSSSSSLSSSRAVSKSKMVGLCDHRRLLKDALIFPRLTDNIFFSIFGMAGIGKTTLAREIFEDLDIIEWFECRVWVTAGRERTLEEITEDILAQVDPEAHKTLMGGSEEEKSEGLKESLKDKLFLIVLDDVWNQSVGAYLQSSFPNDQNGSQVVLTTRLKYVGLDVNWKGFIDMRLLDKEESWDLLRQKVFVGDSCPPHLEDPGKKIAEKCDGLPLTIVTIADLLTKVPQSLWIDVATKRKHKLFVDVYNQISQVRGYDLPNLGDTSLQELITLSDVTTRSCTILSRVSNLKKLGIKIELAPNATYPLCCFDHISHLTNLKSLRCVIVNPFFKLGVVSPVLSFPCFSFSLKKVSLSGMGYPWEEMSKIVSLPNLKVLKLRFNAFRGPEWEVEENGFPNLQALLVEDIDLVKLKWAHGSFNCLKVLRIKHCYKFEELHFGDLPKICEIEIVDCSPLTEWHVKNNALKYSYRVRLFVRSSWKL
ncbi:hypothetical protein ACS0TY_026059 [Phlomoides rotata]